MASSPHPGPTRLLAVVVAAWLLLGAVAGVPLAVASDGTGSLEANDDGLLNETNDTDGWLLEDTTDTDDGVLTETATAVEETTDGTVSTVNETTSETTDTLDDTTTAVEETTDKTVEETGDTVDDTTGGTTNDTTDAVTTATDGATDAVNTTTTNATDTVDDTAATADATTDDTTDAVSAAAEGDLESTTDSLESATGEVTSYTTDQLTTLTETTESATADLTSGTTDAARTLEDGTVDSTTDAVLTDGSVDDATASGAAARVDGDEATPAGGTGGDGDATAENGDGDGPADDERSLTSGAGAPLTALGPDGVPVSEEGATGVGLSALLLGAVGAVLRQASTAGGTGAGTTAAQAGATALANGDGPLSRLTRMLSLFRYSRYDDSDPLELDARRQVYEAISEQPGEPITAISERADVNLSTARHHVKVLQREELVATARVRNCERFYPAGTDDLELAAAMADECTADIIDALVRLEPASVSGLAEEVDRSPSTVTHHLQKLEDDGIVVRERNGRSVENKLSEAARGALDPETERRPHAAERRLETDARADAASGAQAD